MSHEVGLIRSPMSALEVVPVSKQLSNITLALVGVSLAGCQGAFWGNLVVLGVTFGIFFGTLALGRTSVTSSAEASTSTSGSTTS